MSETQRIADIQNDSNMAAFRYSPEQKLLFSGSNDLSLKVFKIDTTKGEAIETDHLTNVHTSNRLYALDYSSKDKQLFTGSKDKSVKIFKVDTVKGKLIQVQHLTDIHTDSIRRIRYDPYNKFLITGSFDKTAKIFKIDVDNNAAATQIQHIPAMPGGLHSIDYASEIPMGESVKQCTACWDNTDITNYATWDARTSFTQEEVEGRDTTNPFKLNETSKVCELQCKTGYQSNLSTNFNKASDANDQRCTFANCKNWNYAGYGWILPDACPEIIITSENETNADTLATKLCPKDIPANTPEVTPKHKVSQRYGMYEFKNGTGTLNTLTAEEQSITLHYLGKGIFIWQGLGEGQEWVLKVKGNKTDELIGCFGYNKFFNFTKTIYITYDGWGNVTKQKLKTDEDGLDPVNTFAIATPVKVPTSAKHCTQCWTKADFDDWDNLDVKDYYHKENILGAISDKPFVLEPEGQTCELECQDGFWTNKASTHKTATDSSNYKCYYDNCKEWNESDASAKVKECNVCWNNSDITNWSTWDAKYSYTSEEMTGRNTTTPFEVNSTNKNCELKCANTYWSNYNSKFNKATDANDQRCTFANCKNWDYAGFGWIQNIHCPEVFTTDYAAADTLATKLCPKDIPVNTPEVTPLHKVSKRYGMYEFKNGTGTQQTLTAEEQSVTLHYLGKGVFIWQGLGEGQEWVLKMKGRETSELTACSGYKLYTDSQKVFITYDGTGNVTKLQVKSSEDGLEPVTSFATSTPAAVQRTSKTCTVCWTRSDIDDDWDNLDVKDYYHKENIKGGLTVPFLLDPDGKTCELRCKNGYWYNRGSTHKTATDASNYKCYYDNCKEWDESDSSAKVEECSVCWDNSDITNYATFDAKYSYTVERLAGRNTITPFNRDSASKTCVQQCTTGYYSSVGANYLPTTDIKDQRCNWANCKNWDWAGSGWIQEDMCPDTIVTDFTAADTLATKLCPKDIPANTPEITPRHKVSKRYGMYEFKNGLGTLQTLTQEEQMVTLHYLGKGVFIWVGLGSNSSTPQEWVLKMKGRQTDELAACKGYKLFTDTQTIYITYDGSGNVTKLKLKSSEDGLDPVTSFSISTPTQLPYTAKNCTECWTENDITSYSNWDGRHLYKEENLFGRYNTQPFVKDTVDSVCKLRCKDGYWLNERSTYKTASTANEFKCYYDNCKEWDESNGSGKVRECSVCWNNSDISNWDTWDARYSYTKDEMDGRDTSTPFERNFVNKNCELKCKSGYWSNYDSVFNKAIDANDQRCTYANCKNWNYAGNGWVDAKSCYETDTHDISQADTQAVKLCPKAVPSNTPEVSPRNKTSLRYGMYEFKSGIGTLSLTDNEQSVTLHYLGRGVFIWQGLGNGQEMPLKVPGNSTTKQIPCTANTVYSLYTNSHSTKEIQIEYNGSNNVSKLKIQDNTNTWLELEAVTNFSRPAPTAPKTTTSKNCTVCWAESDLTGDLVKTFDGKDVYSEYELEGRNTTEPFRLDATSQVCILQCKEDYRTNWGSNFNSASDQNDQRCTYNGCKNWNYNSNSGKPNDCTACWANSDILDYDNWDARSSFTKEEMEGRNESSVFDKFFNTDKNLNDCKLNCKDGYWSNYDTSHLKATGTTKQRCTFNNCKEWDFDVAGKTNKECKVCWDKNDLSTNAEAKVSYTEKETEGAADPPFVKESDSSCHLKCKDGYWENFNSTYNKMADPNDQRCTSHNCKNWDYNNTSDSTVTSKKCTECWSKDDLATYINQFDQIVKPRFQPSRDPPEAKIGWLTPADAYQKLEKIALTEENFRIF